MSDETHEILICQKDETLSLIYLEVPKSQINYMQVMFELYDGLGTVRTIDASKGFICVLTTPSQIEDCCEVLRGLHSEIRWRSITSDIDPLS